MGTFFTRYEAPSDVLGKIIAKLWCSHRGHAWGASGHPRYDVCGRCGAECLAPIKRNVSERCG